MNWPEFPDRFYSLAEARSFCTEFYDWYNGEHRHSGTGMHTPFNVHHGRAPAIHHARARVLTTAYAEHPERFVRQHRSHQRSRRRPGSTNPKRKERTQ
ncbi:hypothetical protein E3T35_18125 [Cryobacterium sp. TMT1-2-2]|uniref:integrase core domain-containing protein n=1 Tax=Cryobacterium sp. TMT1-2-2 TaxID=1259233 RepID=UPI00106D6BEC|nr:hypothetical protein E3T35_18125 [Cryobacterium sp. TMT1-2-2]